MTDHPRDDGPEIVLSILSKEAWCVEVLTTIARWDSYARADLFHCLRPDGSRSTPIAIETLDRYLTLLRSVRFIEQAGETLKITPHGAAAAARLSAGTAMRLERYPATSASIAKSPEPTVDSIRSSSRQIVTEKDPTPARQPEADFRSAPGDQLFSNRRSMPADTNDDGLGPAGGLGQSHVGIGRKGEQTPPLKAGSIQSGKRRPWDLLRIAERLKWRQAWTDDEMPRRKYALLFLGIIAGLVVVGGVYFGANTQDGGMAYRFATVERADLEVSTISTGRIEAIDAVEVSSQLSGQVVELHANFNDEVGSGAPLARLDDKTFAAAVAEAQARLAHAKASYDSARATTTGTNARYEQARQDHERKDTLAKKGSISTREVDEVRANLLIAESEQSAAGANEAVQKAAIDMAEAALRKAEIDLERTVIRSPIDGIVIRRSVELGQTVAVSMTSPTLFTIAQDLRGMRVNARIDEADIGQIRVGQNARSSVDAYPDRIFAGKVVEIHRAPETVQNVVTYTVVISAENPDLALLPGMTAVVHIATTEQQDALLVPNAALRFEPGTNRSEAPRRDEATAVSAGQPAQVWLRTKSADLSPAAIRIGASDGSMTEVVSGPLSEGQEVAIGKSADRIGF